MYQKLIFSAMLFFSIILFSSDPVCSQDESKVVIINQGVDDVTDGTPYKSFSPLKSFQPKVSFNLNDFQSSNQTDLFKINDFQNTVKKQKKPQLSAGKILGEIGAGLGGGILAGGIGYTIGYVVTSPGEGWFGGLRKFAGGMLGFSIGYPIGSSLGVYLVGNMGNETGSYWVTLLGCMGGIAASIPILAIEDCPSGIKVMALFTLSIAGEVIGFNLTRSYKSPHDSGTALLNFRNGDIKATVPTIYFRPNPLDRSDLIQTIDLVKARF